jgi:hypothetical protein
MMLTTYSGRNIVSANITYPVIRRKEMDNPMLEMKTTFINSRDLLCHNTSISQEEERLFFCCTQETDMGSRGIGLQVPA